MWLDNAPAPQDVNSLNCSQSNQAGCVYEDDRIANFTLTKLAAHDPSTPLFMYLTWHNNHEPLEVPQAQLDKFEFVYQNCSAMAGLGGSPNKNNTCTQAYMASEGAADKGCCFRQYYSGKFYSTARPSGSSARSAGAARNLIAELAPPPLSQP